MVLAFVLAVAASMLVALTVTPALAAALLGGDRSPGPGGSWSHPALGPASSVPGRAYRAALRRALRMPRWVLAVLCLAGLGSLAALPGMHPGPPQFQDRNLVIRWTGALGMSLPELDRLAARTSRELAALPAVGDVAATVGRAVSSDQIVSTNSAEIWVTIKPGAAYDSAVGQVRAIADGMPGVAGTVSTYESDSMGGVLAAAPSALTVRLYGSDYGELARLGRQVEAAMTRIGGLGPPRMQLPAGQPTLNVAVNLAAATRNGVKPGDIRREAATLLSGLTVGNFFEQQKVFDVVVLGTPAVRSNLSSVSNLLLDTVNGGHARLGSLARISVATEPEDITHDEMSPYLDVTARLSGRSLGSAMAAMADGLGRATFPLGYSAVVHRPARESGGLRGAAGQLPDRGADRHPAARPGRHRQLAAGAAGAGRAAGPGRRRHPHRVRPRHAGLPRRHGRAARGTRHRDSSGVPGHGGDPPGNPADRGPLTPDALVTAAADASGPVLAAAAVAAVALLPFIVMGDVAGIELLSTAAAVILAGLVTATLLNTLVLPVACLRLGQARDPGARSDQDLAEAHTVPFPRRAKSRARLGRPPRTGTSGSARRGGARAPCHPLRRVGGHRRGGGAGRADRMRRHLRPGRSRRRPGWPTRDLTVR